MVISSAAIHTPTTHSGGRSEAAMATPAIEALISLYLNEKNATAHDDNAISISTILGCVLASISEFKSGVQTSRLIQALMRRTTTRVCKSTHKRRRRDLLLALTILNAID